MTEKKLNNRMLLRAHKDIADQSDNAIVAKDFISVILNGIIFWITSIILISYV